MNFVKHLILRWKLSRCKSFLEYANTFNKAIFFPEKGAKIKVMKYQKKPIIIEAIQWTGKNFNEIEKFIGNDFLKLNLISHTVNTPDILIPTFQGVVKATIGDYIIKGLQGECYPCKPDIFRETYQPIEEGE